MAGKLRGGRLGATGTGGTLDIGDTRELRPLLPTAPSFAGHQTFALRSGWLKKGLDALQTPETGGPTTFTREDALVTLGVGKNMVQAIRHWLVATRMAEELSAGRGQGLRVTDLGQALFGGPEGGGWDPFLEDDSTLWLLHWQLSGPGSQAFTWVWTFTLLRDYEFSRSGMAEAVQRAATAQVTRPPSMETVGRDVECMLHTYVEAAGNLASEDSLDSPLAALGLIRPAFDRAYRFDIGPKPSLPSVVFAYALWAFWQWGHGASSALPVHEVLYGDGSPGTVFKLDEDSVLEYLDDLAGLTNGALVFDDTPLGRQVVRDGVRGIAPKSLLQRHYDG